MIENITPEGIRAMPKLFRITSLDRVALHPKGYQMTATLFHDRASIGVTWHANQPDIRLKPGVLVSPRYVLGQPVCQNGMVRVARVILCELPCRSEDLFKTVPGDWVTDRDLLARASALWERLPLVWQELFNRILWDGERFERFCVNPGSCIGHHSVRNGNLRHMVETGEATLALLPFHPAADPDVSLMAALLHDMGKADEYHVIHNRYRLTDNSILNGHKQTIGDWVAVAEARMTLKVPAAHYMSLRHALGAEQGVAYTSGYRRPRTPEARLLSLADQSSGSGDLYAKLTDPEGGWGAPHPHLGDVAPYSLPRKPSNDPPSSIYNDAP
jgi:3'-5' exoribonuclease